MVPNSRALLPQIRAPEVRTIGPRATHESAMCSWTDFRSPALMVRYERSRARVLSRRRVDAMDRCNEDEIRSFWNRVADDWNIQVGDKGDSNRLLNSDPVLWAFVGDVSGRRVLDAGCGTGYLSQQASNRGA